MQISTSAIAFCRELQLIAESSNCLHRAPAACIELQRLAESSNCLHRAPTACRELQRLAESFNCLQRASTACRELKLLAERSSCLRVAIANRLKFIPYSYRMVLDKKMSDYGKHTVEKCSELHFESFGRIRNDKRLDLI